MKLITIQTNKNLFYSVAVMLKIAPEDIIKGTTEKYFIFDNKIKFITTDLEENNLRFSYENTIFCNSSLFYELEKTLKIEPILTWGRSIRGQQYRIYSIYLNPYITFCIIDSAAEAYFHNKEVDLKGFHKLTLDCKYIGD